MVKGGPFLNSDVDYPTSCSQLVKLKRSEKILDDVCDSRELLSPDEPLSNDINGFDAREVEVPVPEVYVEMADNKMADSIADHGSKDVTEPRMIPEEPFPASFESVVESVVASVVESVIESETDDAQMGILHDTPVIESLCIPTISNDDELLSEPSRESTLNEIVASHPIAMPIQAEEPERPKLELRIEKYPLEEQAAASVRQAEVTARLKRILRSVIIGILFPLSGFALHGMNAHFNLSFSVARTWKRHSSRKREMRERRRSLAYAALSSLSLGPPVRQTMIVSSLQSSAISLPVFSFFRSFLINWHFGPMLFKF